MRIYRPIKWPITNFHLGFAGRWEGPDRGLIVSWECGRLMASEDPERAARARAGELVRLPWKGGTEGLDRPKGGKLPAKRSGCLRYLAMWQGLRGDDLEITLDWAQTLCCAKTGLTVSFAATGPEKKAAADWVRYLQAFEESRAQARLAFGPAEQV